MAFNGWNDIDLSTCVKGTYNLSLQKQHPITEQHKNMSDNYPDEAPPMPASLHGIATVTGGTDRSLRYVVNFDIGECDCQHGAAWKWDNRKWVPGNLCAHKLKAISSKITAQLEHNIRDTELIKYYEESIGRRHNAFVAVSAMHKEIRRGDVEAALYWATCMIPHRGLVGVINYLRNIVFEETRDIRLYRYILYLSSKGRSVTRKEMNRAVARFTRAPKKWELDWRLPLFIDEQKAYRQLADKFTYDVAKPQDQIPEDARNTLHKELLAGFKEADRVRVQYGLKGLLKTKSPDHDKFRIAIFNYLVDVLNGDFPNAFDYSEVYSRQLHEMILMRIRNHGAPGYHEINALCDALTGEMRLSRDYVAASLPHNKHRVLVNSPRVYALPLGDMRRVPLYANDNHTWPGKALMRQYGETELQPGVQQTHIDFRYCGAYVGVAWRLLAWKQRATIDCKWERVKWNGTVPWMWQHVSKMMY